LRKIKDCYHSLENEKVSNKKGDFAVLRLIDGNFISLQYKPYTFGTAINNNKTVIKEVNERINKGKYVGKNHNSYRRIK